MRKTIAKNYLTKLIVCAFLSVCLMLTVALSLSVHANDNLKEDREFSERIMNEQFADASTWPSTPNNWTGEYIGENNGNVISGIIPLSDTYLSNYDSFKLNIYPEYDNKNKIPETPFGRANNVYEGTNRNVLMINTNKYNTAYGYTYSNTNLEANSFYRFSVYAKTGSFVQASGAAITLTGLKEPVGIWDINTVKFLSTDPITKTPILEESNMWGWKEYKIYVATGANSESAALKLSVGDEVETYGKPANGYAFFDNITITKISPTNYFSEIEFIAGDENVCIYDMNPVLNDSTFKNGALNSAERGWKRITADDDENVSGTVDWGYYNAGNRFIKNNAYGMKKDPYTPKGKFDETNTIMILSSFFKVKDENTNEFNNVKAGIASQPFTIEQEKFYMLSFWYNTESITGGAAAVIKGQNTIHSQQYKLKPVAIENLTSNNNAERYGWQRGNFYIRGSLIKDIQLTFEFWLGYNDEASGIAMLDDIALTEIDYFEFSENKLGGQIVTIDEIPSEENISNSMFSDVEYQMGDDGVALPLTYPAKPTNWTLLEPVNDVDENKLAYGVVPTEENHYNKNRANYLLIQNPNPKSTFANKNVLMLAAKESTAFAYRSQSFTVNATSQYELKVNLNAKITSGYGASLVLKKDNKVVSSIEKIQNTNGEFTDYTFYLAGGSQQVSLSLEIWLGLSEKRGSISNLTSGHIFVNSVSFNEVYPDENGVSIVETKSKDFLNPNFNPTVNRFTMYSPGSLDFSAYDRYSPDAVKTAYDMFLTSTADARAGIIGVMPQNQTEILDFENIYAEHIKTEYKADNLIYMRNINKGFSKLESDYSLNLNANAYYRIDFSIMVDLYGLEDDGRNIGAGIWLGDNAFKNIRSTYRTPYSIIDYDSDKNPIYQKELEFKQFSFYYATTDASEQLNWSISLGGTEYSYQEVAGRIFLNSVVITEIDSYAFEDKEQEQEDLDDDQKDSSILIINNSKEQDLDESPDDDDTEGNKPDSKELPWYLLPSIALVAAMLIAVFVISFKKIRARRPAIKNRQKVVSYDRRKTLNKMNADTDSNDERVYVSNDTTFESFDDDQIIEERKSKYTPEADLAESEETQIEQTETIEVESPAQTEEIKVKEPQESEFDD